MTTKKALTWTLIWIVLALIFDTGIYMFWDKQKAAEFLAGFVIEKSLSIDNLFLFLMIFKSFDIGIVYQKRVLKYGVIGAIILRFIFVMLGVAIVNSFHWVLYLFGGVLLYSGIKMLVKDEEVKDFKNNGLMRLLRRFVKVTDKLEGERFFVRKNGILYATPLLAILILIEGSDVVFAIDSIPAIFSVSTNPVIVYSSNIFAILGLRNMYFLLERMDNAFRFVKHGVAFILMFTGIKLLLLLLHVEIPIVVSLLVICGILTGSVLASLLFKNQTDSAEKNYIES